VSRLDWEERLEDSAAEEAAAPGIVEFMHSCA